MQYDRSLFMGCTKKIETGAYAIIGLIEMKK